MKKIVVILVLGFCKLAAQRNPAVPTTTDNIGMQVPVSISTKFNSDYPNMHAVWAMEDHNYRAAYTEGTLDRSVMYDKNGKQLDREEQLTKDNYPAAISTYYMKKYPDERYEVWLKVDSAGKRSYYISRTPETLWFDKNGKYVKSSRGGAPPKLEPQDY